MAHDKDHQCLPTSVPGDQVPVRFVFLSRCSKMASFVLCGCYIADLGKFTIYDVPKQCEGGDLVKVRRSTESPYELAAVLGSAGTKEEARTKANVYLTRIGRIDGVEDTTDLEYQDTQDMDLSV